MNDNSKMNEIPSNFILNVIILPFLLSVFTLFFFGIYFETFDDVVMSMLLSGVLQSGGGAYDLSCFFYRYLVYGFDFLYTFNPGLPWYGFSVLFFNFAAVVNIFYIFYISLSRYFSKSIVTFLLTLFFFTVVAENLIEINFTRTSILLGGSSAIVLFVLLNRQKGYLEWLWIGACSLFVICSVLIRPMAGLLVSFLLLPFILYSGYKLKSLKYSVCFIIIMGFFVTLLFISTQKFRPQDELDLIKYGSSLANIADFEYDAHEQLEDTKELLKMESIILCFVSDRNVLTDDYLERISSDNYLTSEKLTFSRFKTAIWHTSHYLFKKYAGMTLLYFSVLLVILIGLRNQNRKEIIVFVLPQIIYLSSVVLIHTLMKMPERLFVPLYGIYIICTIFTFFLMPLEKGQARTFFNAIPYVFTLAFIISLLAVYDNYENFEKENKLNQEVFRDIKESCSNKKIILTTQAIILLRSLDPLKSFQIGNNRMLPLIGWTTIMPSYYRELKMLCGSENINDFMSFVKGNPDYIFVSDEYFNDFVTRYFLEFYGIELAFQEVPQTPQGLRSRNLLFYKAVSK